MRWKLWLLTGRSAVGSQLIGLLLFAAPPRRPAPLGPSAFAHRIRAVLRCGRRYKPPQLLYPLQVAGQEVSGEEAVLDSLGRHFAGPERAELTAAHPFLARFAGARPLEAVVDLCALPDFAQLVQGFSSLALGKAPGISGLAAEVYRASPFLAAQIFYPVLLKGVLRGNFPFQWTGGQAKAIPKSRLAASLPTGWRSILLLEASAKGVQRAFRKPLVDHLLRLRPPSQFGGLPGMPLTLPAIFVRSHIQRLRHLGASGAVLFLDCRNAYYSVVRDTLFPSSLGWSSQEIRLRAKALFQREDDRERFVRKLQQGELLEALGIEPELLRYVEAQLSTTWFSMQAPSEALFASTSGTAPGSPVADLFFGLLYSRFLADTEALLLSEGIFVAAHSAAGGQLPAPTPTWADDSAFLLGPMRPSAVGAALRRVMEIACGGLRALGLQANLAVGKSEGMPVLLGPGSQKARRDLLHASEPVVAFALPGGESAALRLAPQYVHLGNVVCASGREGPNLDYRQGLARELYRPLRRKVLFSQYHTAQEKTDLIASRVIPRFAHGAGVWLPSSDAEAQACCEPIRKFLRGAFRPVTGVSCAGYSNSEVAAALDLPTAEEYICVARARAFLDVCQPAGAPAWGALDTAPSWKKIAWEALGRVAGHLGFAFLQAECPLLPDVAPSVAAHRNVLRRACKAFLRKCRQSRTPPDLTVPRAAPDSGVECTAASHPGLLHSCAFCSAAFRTKAACSVHKSKKHGHRPLHMVSCYGTRCETCLTEHWNETRLAAHLARSPVCLAAYHHAEVAETKDVPSGVLPAAWRPPMRVEGRAAKPRDPWKLGMVHEPDRLGSADTVK
eukprot:s36_g26.t1